MRQSRRSRFRRWRAAVFFGAMLVEGGALPLEAQESKSPAVTVQPPSGRAAIRAVLRETFRYDPSIRQKALETKNEREEGILKLAPVLVTESRNDPDFDRYLERRKQIEEADKPSIAHGAAVSLSPAATLGVTPYHDPIPFGTPIPRWSILNIRF